MAGRRRIRIRAAVAREAGKPAAEAGGAGVALAAVGMLLAGALLLVAGYGLRVQRPVPPAVAVRPSIERGTAGGRWVVVQPGDTLWSLAIRHGPPGADPRPFMEAIRRANPATGQGNLRPGQVLVLPEAQERAVRGETVAANRAGG